MISNKRSVLRKQLCIYHYINKKKKKMENVALNRERLQKKLF